MTRLHRLSLVVVAAALGSNLAVAEQPAATPTATAATAANIAATEAQPLEGVFKDAFTWRTPDGRSELRLAAAAHFDMRLHLADSVSPSSLDIRRARMDMRIVLHEWMEMRVQAALENEPYIRNAWLDLDLAEGDAFHLRVGQMKVPFSTEWLTMDNQVNFVERATAAPVYPFFDRGLVIWGAPGRGSLTWTVGAFTGAGVDVDATKGDIDDHKDVVGRLFWQPFRGSGGALEGLYLAGEATWGPQSVPTTRFETGGLVAANYESKVWRWRTEQVFGSTGRVTDVIAGEIDSRSRWGLEAHWLSGSFTLSAEVLEVEWDDISVWHDYSVGSTRMLHEPVLTRSGGARSVALWGSWFLTGERKKIDTWGWRQPDPTRSWSPGSGLAGAWELLARLSTTRTDEGLFDRIRVPGYGAGDIPDQGLPAPGSGTSVTAAVLEGAPTLNEATLGVNWTANHNLRLQLNVISLWASDFANGSGGIVSGGNSNLSDPAEKNRQVEHELSVVLRFIFRI